MSYEATKNWSIEQLSGAPVISGDEVYLLDKVDMSIDRINMVTDDHTALEKDIYDVQRYDFEYLAKNRNNEIVLFWTEELDFYSARLKQCRDGTLMSPFRLDGRPVHRGKEGDDEPFEFNETGIFRVDCRSSSRPVVQFTNLDTEYISKKIKFPQWNRSDYSEGDCAFFLTPQKLFGINFRHLYLCSIDIEGKNFVEHDLQLGDNVESLLTYENHNLSVYEDHLYVVYSDTPSFR
uniref:Oligogalacturonate lyase n=1 Tax=Steinernema glaseri TaxID=37863 RepID=A0A1I7YXK1_9BILA